ncbi:transcriptional regulator, TetR family [Microbacterium testaceum StLB037]|uniref:Transcriptional regulator, TetR family n=1 Tax=Microbacterium testaceum (strain StLB037) TaxID=979556 RepID=A0A1H0QIB4_MICTS|nr:MULTISPECIES: TetR family transcriptional regulator C-terminal domain-containing protein [Microbacterium]WDG18107.1 TetR family transcriptional regulator C-terminal domain-containing protein [Microbacterium sp. Clip185]SDP17121.1 transcriptional regulator, TetR family [Microbacterium testaceum StLB037]
MLEIQDAAQRIALTDGLLAVTARSVAAEMGVTASLVVHYERNMEELVARTFDMIVTRELDEVRALVAKEACPTDRVRVLLSTLLAGGRDAMALVWVQSWGIGGRNEALAGSVRTQMDAWEGFVAELIEDGVKAGEFTSDNTRAVAAQMVGMIDGLNAHSLIRWHTPRDRRALMARSVEPLLQLTPGALGER